MQNKNLLHHIATAIGFAGLIGWYYAAYKLGILDWSITLVPQEYAGAGMMVGVMVVMTPGFFLWKHWTRWTEAKLGITGKYYEDDFYKDPPEKKKK